MKKSYSLTIPLLVVITLLLGSCAPRIFLPDRANVPMLREAGEAKLTSSVKLQNEGVAGKFTFSPSFDFSVSPVNHLGLMASFRHTNKYANEDDWFSNYSNQDSIHYSGNRAEFGAGYYMPFGHRGQFEVYGGGAFGSLSRDNVQKEYTGSNYRGNYHVNYYRYFIQPAIGFNVNDVFEFSGGIKFAYHRYKDFKSDDPALYRNLTDPQSDIDNTTFVFIEPFININVGGKFAKFNFQAGTNICSSSPQLSQGDIPAYVSLGLTLQVAPRFMSKK